MEALKRYFATLPTVASAITHKAGYHLPDGQ
jgi:hypothetical protein